ncbi:MAG TPA: xanthine dehydrogenase family protein subunit M [Candidatus Bathyarchaeia archaeon]|nr:xanthine dehydrogenase family protein subunit M [Candidatus Bathyarchaeia archaeon]
MTEKLFNPTEYFRPKQISEAISILTRYGHEARVIAGGTDLLVDKPPEAKYLVDITSLPLDYIENYEGIRIGALTNLYTIEKSALLKDGAYRILPEAVHEIGHINVRNLATIGGNICNAVPSADSPPPLIALDAKVKIVGPGGERIVPLENFFSDVRKTVLKHDELLTEIQIPKRAAHTGTAFCRIGRTGVDIAIVNVAVRINVGPNRVFEDTRIVLGAVAPTPIRAKNGEALLDGQRVDEAVIKKAAQSASEETKPISDVRSSAEYRREMSKVLVKRAVEKALERVV